MPHFIVDCSKNVLAIRSPEEILRGIHDAAEATGLFRKNDLKVRIRPFELFYNGENNPDFIHVFANILEGRTVEQKANLSKQIVTKLKKMFTDVPIISMNVREFERATYTNRNLIED